VAQCDCRRNRYRSCERFARAKEKAAELSAASSFANQPGFVFDYAPVNRGGRLVAA